MGIKGIDVSSIQGNIDWKKVRQSGVEFAILRGVLKAGTLDPAFERNYAAAIAAGVEIKGVYQFLYALTEKAAEAAAGNMVVKLKGRRVTIWLDLEWGLMGILGKNKVTAIAKAYINMCKSLGYVCNVYSNLDWCKNKFHADQLWALGCQLWIARYAKNDTGQVPASLKPGIGEVIWQYSSKGRVGGISGNVDMDEYYPTNATPESPAAPPDNPFGEPAANLRRGSKGTGVKWLQVMLNWHGYSLVVDGDFGTKTLAAVLAFQGKRGLKADGIVGPLTRPELKHK